MAFSEGIDVSVDSVCPLPTYDSVEAEVRKQLASTRSTEDKIKLVTDFVLSSIYEVVLPRVAAEPVAGRVVGQKIAEAPLE